MSEERIPFNIKMFEKNEPVGEQVDPSTNIKFEEEKWDGNVISIKGLHQIFNESKPNEYPLFVDFNLEIPDFEDKGQFISIMGGSGCGKTQLLRAIAGLTEIPKGEIRIYGKKLADYGNIPMVFQHYSSYEWMTVRDNVALPMILRGVPKKEAREKADKLLEIVDLKEHGDKYAKTPALSGGQLQRVSIARCLACNSQILLLDEATSGLDVKMKREVQNILLDIFEKSDIDPTILNVTHSIDEAIYLSNRIIVLQSKPCRVYKTIDIHFDGEEEKGRGKWVLETEEFLKYTKELTHALDEVCGAGKNNNA